MSDSIPAEREGETLTWTKTAEPDLGGGGEPSVWTIAYAYFSAWFSVQRATELADLYCAALERDVAASLATPATDGARAGVPDAVRAALVELKGAAEGLLFTLPGHWHDDATIRLTDAAEDAGAVLSAAEQEDLYTIADPRPQAGGAPGGTDALKDAAVDLEFAQTMKDQKDAEFKKADRAAFVCLGKDVESCAEARAQARDAAKQANADLVAAERKALSVLRAFAAAITRPAADPGAQAEADGNGWSALSPAEIVRRTRCEARQKLGHIHAASWRACCDAILRRMQVATPAPAATGNAGAERERIAILEAEFERLMNALGHISSCRAKYSATGHPSGVYPDAADYMAGYAEAAIMAAQATPPAPSADPVSEAPAGRKGDSFFSRWERVIKQTPRPETPSAAPVPAGQGDGASANAGEIGR